MFITNPQLKFMEHTQVQLYKLVYREFTNLNKNTIGVELPSNANGATFVYVPFLDETLNRTVRLSGCWEGEYYGGIYENNNPE